SNAWNWTPPAPGRHSLAPGDLSIIASERMLKEQQMRWTPRDAPPPAPGPHPRPQRPAAGELPPLVPRLHQVPPPAALTAWPPPLCPAFFPTTAVAYLP